MLNWLKKNSRGIALGFALGVFVIVAMGHSRVQKLIVLSTSNLYGALTVGTAGSGFDVQFFSDTSGDHFLWDSSAEALTIIGTNAADALNVDDGNVDIADDIDVDGTSNLDVVDIDGILSVGKGDSVASAATSFTLPTNGNYFVVTGTATIDSVAASTAGRLVILETAAACTLADGGNLRLSAALNATADDIIALVTDGTDWYEVSRSAN